MACLGSLLHLHTSSCCEGRLTTVFGTCKSSQISSTFPQINGVNILFKFGVNILPILLSKCQSVVPMLRCLILYTVMISFPDWELPLKYNGCSSIKHHAFIHSQILMNHLLCIRHCSSFETETKESKSLPSYRL